MNKEQIANAAAFETVWSHLKRQNAPSLQDESAYMCAYSGSDGKACAIGALMEPERRVVADVTGHIPSDPMGAIEDNGSTLDFCATYLKPQYWAANEDMLNALQVVHDDAAYRVYGWCDYVETMLLRVAKKYYIPVGERA